jgi:hypothetical protein
MLEGEEPIVREYGGVRMTVHGENAALVGRFVVLHSASAKAGE